MRDKLYVLVLLAAVILTVHTGFRGVPVAIGEGDGGQVLVKGVIKSINENKSELVIIDEKTGEEHRVVAEDGGQFKAVKKGLKFKVAYRPGKVNVAVRVSKRSEINIPGGCGGP